MVFKAGAVPSMPDLACIGMIKKVGEVRLSNKGVYHVLPIEIEGTRGGKNGTYFFLFQPRWFEPNFDPAVLLAEDEAIRQEVDEFGKKKNSSLYTMYRRYIADEKNVSVLQALAGDNWDAMAEAFDRQSNSDPKTIEGILREYLTGNEVVYTMTQRTEDDGSLMDQYNISRFYPATEEGLKAVMESAKSSRRKRPLVITWDG